MARVTRDDAVAREKRVKMGIAEFTTIVALERTYSGIKLSLNKSKERDKDREDVKFVAKRKRTNKIRIVIEKDKKKFKTSKTRHMRGP